MENLNTIEKTITGLCKDDCNMIIRALKARALSFEKNACDATDKNDCHDCLEVSKAYNELAKFIENQINR